MKKVTEDILYVGVDDHDIDLFEGQYVVPDGMAYNSYVIRDEKTVVIDTVDGRFVQQWLAQVDEALEGGKPGYLLIQHMEPDHSAGIAAFAARYPDAVLVSNAKVFTMLGNFYSIPASVQRLVVNDKAPFSTGRHTLNFVMAPMVHWPEVMFTYDSDSKVLFSADAFGKFGAQDKETGDWACEARRYYIGIVGKYGAQVQSVLKKAAAIDIRTICPLHGPVLTGDLSEYLRLYGIWSSYGVESEGVMIAYTSVYGNTRKAAKMLGAKLEAAGCPKVVLADLARSDMAECVEDAFRYGKIVLATTTYNAEIFPFMRTFIESLTERNFQGRTIGIIENGSWACTAGKVMRAMLEKSRNITWLENNLRITSAMKPEDEAVLDAMAAELMK